MTEAFRILASIHLFLVPLMPVLVIASLSFKRAAISPTQNRQAAMLTNPPRYSMYLTDQNTESWYSTGRVAWAQVP